MYLTLTPCFFQMAKSWSSMAIFSIVLAIMSLMMFYVTSAQPYDGQMGRYHACYPPINLHLIFEKSSLKNQVGRTGFFLSILNWIFAGYTGSKNQVRNRQKIKFVQLDFSNLIFQKVSTDQQGEFHFLES